MSTVANRPTSPPTAIALAAQRAALRTNRGALRPLWAAIYALIGRGAAAYLRAAQPRAAAYLRGSLAAGEPVYGPADIDLAIVVPAEPGRPGVARRRVHGHWQALVGRLAPLRSIVQLNVYEPDELRHAISATALTKDLRSQPGPAPAADADPAGDGPDRLFADEAGLRIRPGLGGPASDWRRIGGPEMRPRRDSPARHLSAWLELQWWWRLCFGACLDPGRLHVPYLCLKLITQSARVRLWLEQGELVSGHRRVLSRALASMPEEEDALRRALRLTEELSRSPDPPLAEAIGFLLRSTARTAELVAREARANGGTEVSLLGDEATPGELALTASARSSLAQLEGAFATRGLLPLVDWRARTPEPMWLAGRVDPLLADEVLAPVLADPSDPRQLAALARSSEPGLQPAIPWEQLLVLPGARYFDLVHRGVQFECSDPVSFALLAGRSSATFPALNGWSAVDCARRAVGAHSIWLRRSPTTDPTEPGTALGLLIGSARAALFLQSLERHQPELALTLGAAASRLAHERPGSASLLEEAVGAFRAWRRRGEAPDTRAVAALRRLVDGLPAFASPGWRRIKAVASIAREPAAG